MYDSGNYIGKEKESRYKNGSGPGDVGKDISRLYY